MALNLNIYDTAALIAVVENLKEPSSFLLDRYFPNVMQSDTEFVAIDVFTGKRRLAPFVNPLVEARFVEPIGFRTDIYKPPYVKPKTRLDPLRPIRRGIGERIGGSSSPAQREAANLRLEMEDHLNQLTRRLEWMAAKAMCDGAITVVGDGVPSATISFGRASALSVALTGGDRWGQSGVSPVDNIDTWSAMFLKESGFAMTDILFTPLSWKYFRADPKVAAIVSSFQNGNANFQAAGVRAERGGQYLGTWGPYNLYLYYEWFVDPADNVEKPMVPDGTVLLSSPELSGTRAFATIIDPEIGYPSIPFAPKSWTTQDPAARWLMTQSSPLVIPTYVNASFAATVN